MSDEADAGDVTEVHVCWGHVEAEIVVSYLEAHGVKAMISSSMPQSVLPFTVDGLGKIRVMVAQHEADHAKALLAEREQSADPEE